MKQSENVPDSPPAIIRRTRTGYVNVRVLATWRNYRLVLERKSEAKAKARMGGKEI